MLGLFIEYGLEGIYLHVSVWIAHKESQFREICTSFEEEGGVHFLRSKNPK